MTDSIPEEVQALIDQALAGLDHDPKNLVAPESMRRGGTDRTIHTDASVASSSVNPTSIPKYGDPADERPLLVLGVTTWNRKGYLQRFVESFEETRSDRFRWVLVIADDGSTDGTLAYARTLQIPGCPVILIENKARTIAGQANSVISAAVSLGFDFGFKCDDDVFFTNRGWDETYFTRAHRSGFEHLVYHNPEWKPPHHDVESDGLRSSVSAQDSMGCLYTFTPSVVEAIGYMDEVNFPFRGHSHIDYTVRACRAGFNEDAHLWDVCESAHTIDMWKGDEYIDLVDWSGEEVRETLNADERARRAAVIDQPDRVYVPKMAADPSSGLPIVRVSTNNTEIVNRLVLHRVGQPPTGTARWFDAAYVLNLPIDVDKWTTTAGILARHDVAFERFPASDGGTAENVSAWRSYEMEGLTKPIERQINRKLIQSTGAWGYLKSMDGAITEAEANRYQAVLFFDDDVMLHNEFSERLQHVIGRLPENWKLLYLGHSQTDWDAAKTVDDLFYHPGNAANGSFAFALRHSAFQQTLSSIETFDHPFDAGPLRDLERSDPTSVYALWDPLAIADVSTSAIRESRDMIEYAASFGWKLENFETRSSDSIRGVVSAILIVHNQEDTLEQALTSLRHQTYPHIEILCVDNASSDRTGSVIAAAQLKDSRVRHISTSQLERRNVLLNAVLRQAHGRWFFVHDADEVSLPDRLNRLTKAASASESISEGACVADPGAIDGAFYSTGQPPALCAGQRGNRLVRSGLTNLELVNRVGGLLDDSESGFEEVIARIHLAAPDAEGDDVGSTAYCEGMLSSPVSVRRAHVLDTPLDYELFHQEIQRGARSAVLPHPAPVALTEWV